MGSYSSIMRAAILLAVVTVATGAPKFSKQGISTPLSRGVGGSLMCGVGVRVGNHHLYEDDPDQMDIAVSKVILHEDYDSWTIYNDICLLELSGEADFSSSVLGAISLPSDGKEYSAGTACTVSGWGTTSEGGSLGTTL